MIISINGCDLSGKTTQVSRLRSNFSDISIYSSVSDYIEDFPETDKEVDKFFKKMSRQEQIDTMLEGYQKRYKEIHHDDSEIIVMDRGKLNLHADPMTVLYPDHNLEKSYNIIRENIPSEMYRIEDLAFYLEIDKETYLERLPDNQEFSNLEFVTSLIDIMNYLSENVMAIEAIEGSKDKESVTTDILETIHTNR